MTMDGNAGGPRFSIGGVIRVSLSVLFANLWRFLAIMLAVGVPTAVIIGVAGAVMAASEAQSLQSGPLTLQSANTTQVLFLIAAAFLGMLAYFLIQSALTYGALQTLRGTTAGIGACISNGLNALPRVLVASLIFFVIMFGVGFLIVWGLGSIVGGGAAGILVVLISLVVILGIVVVFWVFIPATVVEHAGPVECFRRSMALTNGHRWGILAIILLIFVANFAISYGSRMLVQFGAPAAGGVLDFLAGLFFMALNAVLAAVGYYYLRAEKEGVAIDDVVKVFD